ncbi:MAG: TFIIB-type zinc ribbon-containing protein [Anaerolineaceae bacterium]
MNNSKPVSSLSCPRCGGMIQIPEGYSIVKCPFCDLRSVIQGEKGIPRYQVPVHVSKEAALQSWGKFLTSTFKIARHTNSRAKLSDAFLVFVPFWNIDGHGLGWGFGKKRVGSGDNQRYVPKEIRVSEELHWNCAACDVSEFGVNHVKIDDRPTFPFDQIDLHRSGLVFEPVGSSTETLKLANQAFEDHLKERIRLDRQTQLFVRIVKPKLSLVYYPLWIIRYIVQGRAFQVVVDGFSGEVIYGKAPGSITYRAAALVFGMAIGSFIAIDGPAFILKFGENVNPIFILILFLIGMGLMVLGWRIFRYSEHYEYQRYKAQQLGPGKLEMGLPQEARELIETARKIGLLRK